MQSDTGRRTHDDALDFTEKQTILVVDDTPDNLTLMTGVLKDAYKTKVANNGERGAAASPPRSRCRT